MAKRPKKQDYCFEITTKTGRKIKSGPYLGIREARRSKKALIEGGNYRAVKIKHCPRIS